LYENSLSNKGQLSAWRLLETTDLLSIVENLYLTGATQLLQRDAGMIILKKEWIAPSPIPLISRSAPAKHQKGIALQVGEMVIDYAGLPRIQGLVRCRG
jgi:hypothetical protein